MTNLLKYALGLNPLVAVANSVPVSDIENVSGANYLVLTVVMPYPTPQGVTEIIEGTGSLGGSWSPAATLPGYPIVNGSTQTLKARDAQPSVVRRRSDSSRLRVTRPHRANRGKRSTLRSRGASCRFPAILANVLTTKWDGA